MRQIGSAMANELPAATPVDAGGQFGWYHPPCGAAGRVGVVLCNAFGAEMLCAHAGWRALAIALAAAGLPTLRFDYAGTGDSAGEDREPDRLGVWSGGINAAIDAFRQGAGVDRVIVVGLRLGATLAAGALAGRGDVAGFAALAPVTSGRNHARELAVLARLNRLRPEDAPPDADEIGGIGVNGFFFSEETLGAIKALDLRGIAPPAADILLLEREGAADAVLWRGEGMRVETALFAGYDTFMDNPTTSVPPAESWRRVVDWCGAIAAKTAGEAAPATGFAPPRVRAAGCTETPLHFGRNDSLFGILSAPEAGAAADLAVIILNAGRNPHIGWGRGAVEMARALATKGTSVLRLDAAGIGDSPAWPDGPGEVLYSPDQKADVRAAMDALTARGFRRFHLVGACGGAYLALHTARDDTRVAGFSLVNLLKFHWREGDSLAVAMAEQVYRPTNSYLQRLKDPETWRRILRGEVALAGIAGALARRIGHKLTAMPLKLFARLNGRLSPQAEAAGWFRALAVLGVVMQMILSAEDPALAELALYFGQEGRDLPPEAHVRVEILANADHNLSQRDARLRTLALVEEALAAIRGGA